MDAYGLGYVWRGYGWLYWNFVGNKYNIVKQYKLPVIQTQLYGYIIFAITSLTNYNIIK